MTNPLHLQANYSEFDSILDLFKELGKTTISDLSTYKRCYGILCELVDNIKHHGSSISQEESLVTLTFDANNCAFYARNVVSEKAKKFLTNRIDYINRSSQDHLHQARKLLVKHGTTNSDSTGLGLLVMKQKAQNELKYTFAPYKKPEYYLFELKIDLSSTHEYAIDSTSQQTSVH